MTKRTTGLNPAWVAGNNFIMLHLDLVDALSGDFHAALLLERIKFRAGDGWWTATRDQLERDTRLSEYQVHKALKHLRDVGFLETQRVSPYDPTLMYRVIIAAKTVNVETTTTTMGKPRPVSEETTFTRGTKTTITSTKNSKELDKNKPLPEREDVESLCALLADEIEANGSRRPTITKAWRDAARLMLDRDGIEYEMVAGCIRWCQSDDFWRSNVLSMQTLRKQYDRLRLKAEAKNKPSNVQGWIALMHETMDNESQGYPQLEA